MLINQNGHFCVIVSHFSGTCHFSQMSTESFTKTMYDSSQCFLLFCRTNLDQLLFELLDFTDVKLTQQVIHKAGHRLEQLLLFRSRGAVVIGDGQFCEAVLISL